MLLKFILNMFSVPFVTKKKIKIKLSGHVTRGGRLCSHEALRGYNGLGFVL